MLTYPLMMPVKGVRRSEFRIERNESTNQLNSGATPTTEIAPPYWSARIDTADIQRRTDRYKNWRQFTDGARGSMKVVLLWDADLPVPQAYDTLTGMTKAGGGAFVGTGNVDVVDNAYTRTISGLPANFVFTAGDYISFMKGGRYSLHRIVQDVVGNGSGVAVVVVEPYISSVFDADATFNVFRACGEFLIDSRSLSTPRDLEGGAFSFTARSRAY
jgi:hypothetical protein